MILVRLAAGVLIVIGALMMMGVNRAQPPQNATNAVRAAPAVERKRLVAMVILVAGIALMAVSLVAN